MSGGATGRWAQFLRSTQRGRLRLAAAARAWTRSTHVTVPLVADAVLFHLSALIVVKVVLMGLR